jgi:hypothetical protein
MTEPQNTTTKQTKAEEPKEPTFEVSRILAEAESLGLDPHEVAGALANERPGHQITVSEVKERVRKWQRAEIKTDDPNAEE